MSCYFFREADQVGFWVELDESLFEVAREFYAGAGYCLVEQHG